MMGSYGSDYHKTDREHGVKKVFTNYHEVACLWAEQSQSEARYRSGKMYFEGATIYSYRSNWPIGHIFEGANARSGVLLNDSNYSVTTSSHQREVRSVAQRAGETFYCSLDTLNEWLITRDQNKRHLAYFTDMAKRARELLQRSLKACGRKADFIAQALSHLRNANRYAEFFGLPLPYDENMAPEAARFAIALGAPLLTVESLLGAQA